MRPSTAAGTAVPAARLVLFLAAAAFVALRLPTAAIPLERDEGEYSYTAQRMLQGDLPYRDIFDQKPPGVFLAYALPVALFGTSIPAIHLNLYLWSALTTVFLFLIARELAGDLVAAFAVLLFACLSIAPDWAATAANTEQFMLLPLTAALWAALRATRAKDRRWWFASGACAMAAFWCKQVAVFEWPLILGLPWILEPARLRAAPREAGKDALVFGLGAATFAIPIPAYFLFRGAWAEFLDCVFLHNLDYIRVLSGSESLAALRDALGAQTGEMWLVWSAALAAFWCGPSSRRAAAVGWAWLALAAAGTAAGRYFMPHYFIQLAPALAFTAALAAGRLAEVLQARLGPRRALPVAGALALAFLGPPLAHSWGFWTAGSPEARAEALYPGNLFGESGNIAAYLATHTEETDRVLVFGSEPQILFLARRRSATRYIIFYPLMMGFSDALARQQAAFAEIERSNPRYILLADMRSSWLAEPDTPSFLQDRVLALRKAAYRLDGVVWQDAAGAHEVLGPAAPGPYAEAFARGRVRSALLLFARTSR